MSSMRHAAIAAPRIRRTLWWRAWRPVVFVLLAAWFARFAYLRITLRPTPRPEYWAARIAAIDPPNTGAISAEAACAILKGRPWETDLTRRVPNYAPDITRGEWNPARSEIASLDATFRSEAYERAFQRVRQATTAGWQDDSNPRPDWPTDLSQHCQTWAGYLASHSRWVIETSGDLDRAAVDWLTLIQIGRQIRRTQTSLRFPGEAFFQQCAIREMMGAAVEHPGRLNVHLLAAEITAIIGPPSVNEMLERDRLYINSMLEHRYVRDGGNWLDLEAAIAAARFTDQYPSSVTVSRWWNIASPFFHDLGTARNDVERLVESLRTGSFDEAFALFDRGDGSNPWLKPYLQGDTESGERSILFGFIRNSITRSEIDAALAMLALADHHAVVGTYPDRLEQLVPDRLPRLPIDVFSGEPIRYRRVKSGYVLYSVGRDRSDGGGSSVKYHSDDVNTQECDIVFSAYRRSS